MNPNHHPRKIEQDLGGINLSVHYYPGSVAPSCVLICLPGVGGFGLGLYQDLARDMTRDANMHVVTVDFQAAARPGGFPNIVAILTEYLRSIQYPIMIIGWSYGGAVALELAHALRDKVIKGVVTIASQGAPTEHQRGRGGIVGIETLTPPLLFVAGTADSCIPSAPRIATEFEEMAVKSSAKSSLIIEGAGHDCRGSEDYVYAWIMEQASKQTSSSTREKTTPCW